MSKILRVGQIGAGSMICKKHSRSNEVLEGEKLVERVAVAEAYPKTCADILKGLRKEKVRIYTDWMQMLNKEELDVLVNAAPHHTHVPYGIEALKRGINVFTEKPPAVTVESGKRFVEEMRQSGKMVGVNYMYTAAKSAEYLKRFIDEGKLGNIERIVAKGLWARTNKYYDVPWRGEWEYEGEAMRDGCLFNQFAHLLNQCIYFLTKKGVPKVTDVMAELYRGHRKVVMKTEDTVSLSAKVNGVPIYLYGTVCNECDEDLTLEVVGDKGTAYWSFNNLKIEGAGNPEVPDFSKEDMDSMCERMYRNFIASVGADSPLIWGLDQSLVLTGIVAPAQDRGIIQIPRTYAPEQPVKGGGTAGSVGQEGLVPVINDIREIIEEAAQGRKMYSQVAKAKWARQR